MRPSHQRYEKIREKRIFFNHFHSKQSQYVERNEGDAQNKFFNPTGPNGAPEDIAVALETQEIDHQVLPIPSIRYSKAEIARDRGQ